MRRCSKSAGRTSTSGTRLLTAACRPPAQSLDIKSRSEVSDGQGGFDTQDITVNVTPPNRPPVAVADTASTKVNTPVIIPVLANDTDPDNTR